MSSFLSLITPRISKLLIRRVHVTSVISYYQRLATSQPNVYESSKHLNLIFLNSLSKDSILMLPYQLALFIIPGDFETPQYYYLVILPTKFWGDENSKYKKISSHFSLLQIGGCLLYRLLLYNLITIFQIQTMEVELRLADTGHSEKIVIDPSVRGQILMNEIARMYKINQKDQMVITKIGHIIEPHEYLDKIFSAQFQDKTLVSSQFSNADNKSEKRIPCVFLFNIKQLKKPEDSIQLKSRNYWIQELKQKLINLNSQKIVALYEPLQKSYSPQNLQKYKRYAQKINTLKSYYQRLASQYSQLEEYYIKIEQTIDRCTIQKKSGTALIRCFNDSLKKLSQKIKSVGKIKQSLNTKFAIDDKSLRENSGFFQNKKKNQKSAILYDQQFRQLRQKIDKFGYKIKEEVKKFKNRLKLAESSTMNIGNQNYKDRIQQVLKQIKKDYNDTLQLFNSVIENSQSPRHAIVLQNKLQKLEQQANKILVNQFQNLGQQLVNSYCQLNKMNQQIRIYIKQLFKWYSQSLEHQKDYQSQLILLENTMKAELLNHRDRQLSIISKQSLNQSKIQNQQLSIMKRQSRDSNEITRRINFNKRLNFIQSYISKMCEQQQYLRKQYVNDFKNNQKCVYQCLKNTKVPQIDIQNTSADLQLIKLMKSSSSMPELSDASMNIQQFMIYNYNRILQKLKIGLICETNSKIKNMQQILIKMSDIFNKAYTFKINDAIQDKLKATQKLEINQQKLQNAEMEINRSKQQLLELQKKLIQKDDLIMIRQKQRSDEINKQRSKYDKLLADFKSLQKSLNKQTKINEQLYNLVQKSDEQLKNTQNLNQCLKEMLAQKQLQIIEIQKQLDQLKPNQINPISSQSLQNDLKSAVLHNFGKNINQSYDKDHQIQRLNQQIAMLQKQNEDLQEEYQELSSQMRKIITKETQDIEVQVDVEPIQKSNAINQNITINQDITIGQNAIFMPFSSNLYVGINHKDDDRTLCNINRSQTNHYLLDLTSFNSKTQQLLNQCSFLVVLAVQKLDRNGKSIMAKGKIKYLLGFQDDNFIIKNYSSLLPS